MSTIKNTSKKIINIGSKILLPGDEFKTANPAILAAPSILAMSKVGQLAIISEETAPAAEPKAAEPTATVTATTAEPEASAEKATKRGKSADK